MVFTSQTPLFLPVLIFTSYNLLLLYFHLCPSSFSVFLFFLSAYLPCAPPACKLLSTSTNRVIVYLVIFFIYPYISICRITLPFYAFFPSNPKNSTFIWLSVYFLYRCSFLYLPVFLLSTYPCLSISTLLLHVPSCIYIYHLFPSTYIPFNLLTCPTCYLTSSYQHPASAIRADGLLPS